LAQLCNKCGKKSNKHFWIWGYFVSTIGRNEKIIRAYIRHQEFSGKRQSNLPEFEYTTAPSRGPHEATGSTGGALLVHATISTVLLLVLLNMTCLIHPVDLPLYSFSEVFIRIVIICSGPKTSQADS